MGTLRSNTDHSGMVVNGILLGIPSITETGEFLWDDSALPTGEIGPDGTITIDQDLAILEEPPLTH